MGCGRMSPALFLLLFLASCSLLQGMLLRPRHVRLEAQNFHVWLRWEPDPSSPSYATYEVEWRNRTLNWTKADACGGNSRSSWGCKLYFDRIHDIYWARVRVVAGGEQSEWASSSELQLYRDTIVGPPRLSSWVLQDQILSINIITPLTPYQRRTGSYKPVDRVLLKLWYWLQLYQGDLLIQQVPCKQSSEEVPCTLGHLRPSTRYCVRTVAAGIARERSREAEECLVTPAGPAGFPWVAVLSASSVLLSLIVGGLCLMKLRVFPKPPQTRLPRALVLQNSELSVAMRVPPLQLEEDPLAVLLQTVLPSHGPSTPGQASATVPQLIRGLAQDVSGYCANGFGPDCPEERDPSCTHRVQLGHALGCQVPSQLEKDGEAGDGDDLPEDLVQVGLTGNSYVGDRDSQIPEIWLPLHFQLYSKCQCPALEAGSHLPLPVPSRSCGQEYPQESLGAAGHCIRLSSVKLPASAEEEGGQLLCAPQPLLGGGPEPEQGDGSVRRGCPEQAEPCVPSPCQPSPRSVLRAVPFSDYEPRAPPAASHSERGSPAASCSRQSPGRLPELPSHEGCLSQPVGSGMGMGLGLAPTGRQGHIPGTAAEAGRDPELSSGVWCS